MTTDTRADRQTIREAAAAVRSLTIQDQYRGGQHPAVAFSLALTLDELALHSRTLPDDLRAAVVQHCRTMRG